MILMENLWIFELSLGVCSTELRNLVSSLEYLVSIGRQVLLRDIGLGGSATRGGAGERGRRGSGWREATR